MEINNLVTQQVNNQLHKKPEDQGDVFGEMLSAGGNISTPALFTNSLKPEDQGDVFGEMLSAGGNISTPALSSNSLLTKQQVTNSAVNTAFNLGLELPNKDVKLTNENVELTSKDEEISNPNEDLANIKVFSQWVNNSQISAKDKLSLTRSGTTFQFADTPKREQTFSFNPLQDFNTVIKMPSMTASSKDLIGAQLSETNQIAQTVVESYAWSLLANSELSQHSTFQFVTPEKNWPSNAIDKTTKSLITTSSKSSVAVATSQQRAEKTSNNLQTSNTAFIFDKKNNRIKTTATSPVIEPSLRQFEIQMNRVSFYLNEEDKRSKLVIRDYFDASLYSESGLRELIGSLDFFNISTDEIKLNGYVIKGESND